MTRDQPILSPSGPAPDPRILALRELVPSGARVADVGTDHAALPLALLASGRASHCIATEKSRARLAPLLRLRTKGRLPRSLELRSGDGLTPLRRSDRIDVIVLAGMGGRTIRRVLDPGSVRALGVRRVVVQPQTETALVRRHLLDMDLGIVEERLSCRSRRFYFVIAAEPGHGSRPEPHPVLARDELLEVGPCLLRDAPPGLAEYWSRQRARCEAIVRRAGPGESGERARRRRDLADRVLRVLGDRDGGVRSRDRGVL